MLSSYVTNAAKVVELADISFFENKRCISYMTKIEGYFYFNSEKIVLIYYSAPPTTLLNKWTELMILKKICYFDSCLIICESFLINVDFPVPENPLTKIPFNGPKPFDKSYSLSNKVLKTVCLRSYN